MDYSIHTPIYRAAVTYYYKGSGSGYMESTIGYFYNADRAQCAIKEYIKSMHENTPEWNCIDEVISSITVE